MKLKLSNQQSIFFQRIFNSNILVILLLIILTTTGCVSSRSDSAVVLGNSIPAHPRLLFTADDEQRIKKLAESDSLLVQMIDLLEVKAEELLNEPIIEYTLRDVNYIQDILPISREHVYRITTLAMAYRLTGDKRFASKAEENIINVCNYPDWNPKHYLDVAEMTTAVAIGYDWLYDFLPNSTKQLIVGSIQEKALVHALEEYRTGDNNSWAKRETNWNVVCNTGMIIGALAIAEENPAVTDSIITQGTSFVPNCLKHYAPDGVCYEGPSYWGYTNIFLTLLLKSLEDNFNADFGIVDIPGVKNTVNYYIESISPGGRVFNFANSGGTKPAVTPVYFYYSRSFDQPKAATFYRRALSEIVNNPQASLSRHFFLSIPWYDPSGSEDAMQEDKKLQVFDNEYNPIAVFNGAYDAENSVYLIAKGGAPTKAHQQLDVGTFIIETNGVRWTDDLGADSYSLPGFWDYKPGGQRWDYFRNTNFGHNTLSIDGKLQYSAGEGDLLRHNSNSGTPFCIFDLSPVYQEQASTVFRGFKLLENDLMVIRDEVELLPESESIEWSAITSAQLTKVDNVVNFKKDGEQLYLKVIEPHKVTIHIEEAKTFTPKEKPLEGYHRLSIKTVPSAEKKQVIQIIMSSNPEYLKNDIAQDQQTLQNWK